jgi:acetoin utilization deacetylase AcuC-like enzyme
MGFCLFNNAAVAAMTALNHADRVAIIDWDVHHGNGTQHTFYGTDRVLYCSIHQKWVFPFSGRVDEVGTGSGRGYTINAPLAAGSSLADYSYIFSEIFAPALERFKPDVLIVSAGQDTLHDDLLGGMMLQPRDFSILTRLISDAAGVPLALVLEGGYGISHGAAVACIFSALQSVHSQEPAVTQKPGPGTLETASLLKKVHNLP